MKGVPVKMPNRRQHSQGSVFTMPSHLVTAEQLVERSIYLPYPQYLMNGTIDTENEGSDEDRQTPSRASQIANSEHPGNLEDRPMGTSLAQTLAQRIDNHADSAFSMHIEAQPPARVRLGETLAPPVVIRVRGGENDRINDGYFFALAHVVSSNGEMLVSPPLTDILTGTMTDSVHPRSATEGYFEFSNLQLNELGRFRIRFSLFRLMVPNDQVENIQSATTREIHVRQSIAAAR